MIRRGDGNKHNGRRTPGKALASETKEKDAAAVAKKVVEIRVSAGWGTKDDVGLMMTSRGRRTSSEHP